MEGQILEGAILSIPLKDLLPIQSVYLTKKRGLMKSDRIADGLLGHLVLKGVQFALFWFNQKESEANFHSTEQLITSRRLSLQVAKHQPATKVFHFGSIWSPGARHFWAPVEWKLWKEAHSSIPNRRLLLPWFFLRHLALKCLFESETKFHPSTIFIHNPDQGVFNTTKEALETGLGFTTADSFLRHYRTGRTDWQSDHRSSDRSFLWKPPKTLLGWLFPHVYSNPRLSTLSIFLLL